MTDPINAPFTGLASAIGESDDRMFEAMYTELCQRDLRNATTMELSFALGVAAGTVLRLRKQLADLKKEVTFHERIDEFRYGWQPKDQDDGK
jgi:hypothetical protein